jgi:hypothetical protein
MEPLMNAPSVIPQLILNLCAVSIATCNIFFNQMTHFNMDKIRPRVTAKVGGKMFSWLFYTGASATCMTSTSFHAAFPDKKNQGKFRVHKTALPLLETKCTL